MKMDARAGWPRGVMVAAMALTCAAASCGCRSARPAHSPGQPPDHVTVAWIDATGGRVATTIDLPDSAYSRGRPSSSKRGGPPTVPLRADKRHPLLRAMLMDSTMAARVETLIVAYRDPLRLPRFPVLPVGDVRKGTAVADTLAVIGSLIQSIRAQRAIQDHADSVDLAHQFGAHVIHSYWLIRGHLVSMPLNRVDALADQGDVLYIEPRYGGELPPQPGTIGPNQVSSDDVSVGRGEIGSDTYVSQGYGQGDIALLDTGPRVSHELLANPSHLATLGDCTTGLEGCAGGNPRDGCGQGHGTASAAILAGNSSRGDAWRGVTAPQNGSTFRSATLHSFKVYRRRPPAWLARFPLPAQLPFGPPQRVAKLPELPTAASTAAQLYHRPWFAGGCTMDLDHDAAILGFEAAAAAGATVIVAQIQEQSSSSGALAQAADHAYDTGHVVIAANGNYDKCDQVPGAVPWEPGGCVASPANARKAIGVGAYELGDVAWDGDPVIEAGQSRGPTLDGRVKPDLQSITNTETASNAGDHAYWNLSGTSGATPYAGGAALLSRNWLEAQSLGPVDPGQVYAYLILSTHRRTALDCERGAGLLKLPPQGDKMWFGQVTIGDQSTVTVPLDLAGTSATRIEAAIWWPEKLIVDPTGAAADTHNDVDLYLGSPAGTVVDRSQGVFGVFERAGHAVTASQRSVWHLQMYGFEVLHGPQTVYFCAWAH